MLLLIAQLFAIFGPMAVKIYQHYQDTHNGQSMTDAQLIAAFNSDIEAYLLDENYRRTRESF